MAVNLNPKCKQCRRIGIKLFLKGERCYTPKCALIRRSYPPGQRGPLAQRRLSEYGMQLQEKQKIKKIYGVMERQLKRYFREASKKENVSEAFLDILEKRLDNVVYRLGLATSRHVARQIVTHGHIMVNSKRVDVPSYTVKTNDVINIRPSSLSLAYFKNISEQIKNYKTPSWLALDKTKLEGKIISSPNKSELELEINIQPVIEFYSR